MDGFGHPPYIGWKTRTALFHTAHPQSRPEPLGGLQPTYQLPSRLPAWMASAAHPTQGGKRAQRFSIPPPSLPRTGGWASAHPPATESPARVDGFGHPPYIGWKTRAALFHTAPRAAPNPGVGFSPPTGYRVACPRGWLRPPTLRRVENARSAFPHRPPPEPPRTPRGASAHLPATGSPARVDGFGHPPYVGWKTRAALFHTAPRAAPNPRGTSAHPPATESPARMDGFGRPPYVGWKTRAALVHTAPNPGVGFSPPTGYRVACPRGWLRPSTLRRVENARSAFPHRPQSRPDP